MGSVQVRPPSIEVARAIPSLKPPLKRESCQTTYSLPVEGSAAIAGISDPVRTWWWLLGSVTPIVCDRSITIGDDQVIPLSVDRCIATRRSGFALAWVIRRNTLTNAPPGRTRI